MKKLIFTALMFASFSNAFACITVHRSLPQNMQETICRGDVAVVEFPNGKNPADASGAASSSGSLSHGTLVKVIGAIGTQEMITVIGLDSDQTQEISRNNLAATKGCANQVNFCVGAELIDAKGHQKKVVAISENREWIFMKNLTEESNDEKAELTGTTDKEITKRSTLPSAANFIFRSVKTKYNNSGSSLVAECATVKSQSLDLAKTACKALGTSVKCELQLNDAVYDSPMAYKGQSKVCIGHAVIKVSSKK